MRVGAEEEEEQEEADASRADHFEWTGWEAGVRDQTAYIQYLGTYLDHRDNPTRDRVQGRPGLLSFLAYPSRYAGPNTSTRSVSQYDCTAQK